PCVRLLLLHIVGFTSAVPRVPGDRVEHLRLLYTVEVPRVRRRLRLRPARVLPLRLAGQPDPEAWHPLVDPLAEALTVLPAHPLHWPLRPLEVAGVLAHHRLPERLRHRRVGHPVPAGDRHLMLRPLVVP